MDPIAAAVLSSWTLDWGSLCLLLTIAALYFRGWLHLHAQLPHKYTTGRLASFAGGLLWWWVVGVWARAAVWPRGAMIPYLLFAGMVNMGLSAVLSFSNHVLYTSYAMAPRLWGISALEDQAAAGGIMWVPGSITMLIPAAVLGMRALETRRAYPARPVLRVLTPHRRKQWDLLRIPILGTVLRYRHFRRCIQAAMLLLAAIVAFDGFFGPQV